VPRECAELAELVSEHRGAGLRAAELPAEDLLALLQSFDVYRRPQRFEQFLAACETAQPVEGEDAAARTRYLQGAVDCARNPPIQVPREPGYPGAALGEALARQRLEALQQYRETAHP